MDNTLFEDRGHSPVDESSASSEQPGLHRSGVVRFRMLEVLEEIAKNGPISLKELDHRIAQSRSAIWRSCNVLRDYGWIRAQLGSGKYVLTPQFDDLFIHAKLGETAVALVEPVVRSLLNRKKFTVDVGIFTDPGKFRIIESSQSDLDMNVELSLVKDPTALAALLGLRPSSRQKHLKEYAKSASAEEQADIENGHIQEKIDAIAKVGFVWSGNYTSLSIPFHNTGGTGALRVSLKQPTASSKLSLTKLAEQLINALKSDL